MSRTSTALTALAQLRGADVTSRALELARAEQDLQRARDELIAAERRLVRWRAEFHASCSVEQARCERGEARARDWVRQDQYRDTEVRRGELLRRARDEARHRLAAEERGVRSARQALAEAHGRKEAVERCLGDEVRLAAGRAERLGEDEAVDGALARWSFSRRLA